MWQLDGGRNTDLILDREVYGPLRIHRDGLFLDSSKRQHLIVDWALQLLVAREIKTMRHGLNLSSALTEHLHERKIFQAVTSDAKFAPSSRKRKRNGMRVLSSSKLFIEESESRGDMFAAIWFDTLVEGEDVQPEHLRLSKLWTSMTLDGGPHYLVWEMSDTSWCHIENDARFTALVANWLSKGKQEDDLVSTLVKVRSVVIGHLEHTSVMIANWRAL